jgi:hypothetical protein
VSYTVTGPATVSGAILTITGAGTVTVTATQTGNATYAPASWVSHSFTVSPATPTIKWTAPAAITYGTTLSGALNATAANGQTSVPGAFTYSAQSGSGTPAPVTAATILTPGSYTLGAQFNPTDTTDYNSATGSVALTVNKAAPTVAVSSNANPVFAQQAVTLTAKVASTVSMPTGSVNFIDGSATIGSAPLTNGSAAYTTTALSAGSHSITAVYAGDANFVTITSSALAQTIADFSVAASGSSSQTIKAGSSASYSLTVAPVGVSTVPAAISLSATGLPSGATATFSPTTVASGSGSTTVSMTVQTSASARMEGIRLFGKGALPLMLSLLVLPFARRTRLLSHRLRKLLSLAVLFIAGVLIATGITSCGGSSNTQQSQPQTYTVTVAGASGSLSHSATVTLVVE